jgi:hypothetical protein
VPALILERERAQELGQAPTLLLGPTLEQDLQQVRALVSVLDSGSVPELEFQRGQPVLKESSFLHSV